MFEELPAPSQGRPTPWLVRVMRAFGLIALVFVVVGALTNPGDGASVALALAVFLVGLGVSLQRRKLPPGVRAAGLVALGAGSCALSALQPNGAAVGGIYITVIIAAMRLQLPIAAKISGLAVGAEALIVSLTVDEPVGAVLGLTLSIVPWFMVARLLRELREGKERAEELVEELQESRAAHAESVALAERARVAREMHDVLAHS